MVCRLGSGIGNTEIIPKRIVALVGDTRIETNLNQFPFFCLTDGPGKRDYITVGIGITEGFTYRVVEILTVDENCYHR